jgi:signal transduction histidine kinase
LRAIRTACARRSQSRPAVHTPGTGDGSAGIGLVIAGDLLEMWGGSLTLDAAPIGGLRVAILVRRP